MKKWIPATRSRWLLVVVAVVFLGIMIRVAAESGASHERGVSAMEAGHLDEAVFHFRAAAQWYLPGLPSNESALEYMESIATEAEKECEGCPLGCGDAGAISCDSPPCTQCVFALHAYDSIRSAILGTRSFYTPHGERLDRINDKLVSALSRARESHPNGPRTGLEDRESQERFYRERLGRDMAPNPWWSLLATLAFVFWIGALFMAIWRGMPSGDEINRSALVRFGLASCGFFLVWVASLFFL